MNLILTNNSQSSYTVLQEMTGQYLKNDGPASDGPGIDGPGNDGPGTDGPGTDGPGNDREPSITCTE